MYGISPYIWVILQVNIGKYTIHVTCSIWVRTKHLVFRGEHLGVFDQLDLPFDMEVRLVPSGSAWTCIPIDFNLRMTAPWTPQ